MNKYSNRAKKTTPLMENNMRGVVDMKISEMVISALLKKGVLYEARKIDASIEIPDTRITVKINIEHMTLRFDKDEKKES